jgi:hypothetical protein
MTKKDFDSFSEKTKIFVVGVQKAGTTTLADFLGRCPDVASPYRKEIHYFDAEKLKSKKWYYSWYSKKSVAKDFIYDATPYYVFSPFAIDRIKEMFPNGKIIVLLRDPVKRAASSYWHEVRLGRENRTFSQAIREERNLIENKSIDRLGLPVDGDYDQDYHQQKLYMCRSMYAAQLERLFKNFDQKNILIVKSEALYKHTESELRSITRFIGLASYSDVDFVLPRKRNEGFLYSNDADLMKEIHDVLLPDIKELKERYGISWE